MSRVKHILIITPYSELNQACVSWLCFKEDYIPLLHDTRVVYAMHRGQSERESGEINLSPLLVLHQEHNAISQYTKS